MNMLSTAWFRLSLFAALAALGGCVSGADTAKDGKDGGEELGSKADPIIGGVKATAYPESALINMYQNGQLSAYCSGSIIAPRVALTAGHCVHNITSWVVKAPFANGQQAQASKGLVYDWNVDGENVDPKYHDIGLIILDSPIQLDSYPTLGTSKLADNSKIVNIGRIQDGTLSTTSLFVSPQIAVTDGAGIGFPLDYQAVDKIESGDSGGPDILAGTHTIVAVNSGAGQGTEVLARVDLLASWIQQQIAANGGGGSTGGGGQPPGGGNPPGGGGQPPGGAHESEPNDSYRQANPVNGSIAGDLSSGDQDWFTWSIGGADPYEVQLSATGDAEIEMWKLVSGRYYQINNTSETEISHTASGAGSYVIAVYSPSDAQQSYTLTVSK